MFEAHEVAVALLNWRARFLASVVEWPAGGDVTARFAAHLSAKDRTRHLGDLTGAVAGFGRVHRNLVDWHLAVVRRFDHVLVFDGGRPSLRVGSLGAWRSVSAQIDADALLALAIAVRSPSLPAADLVAELPSWGFFAGPADHGLEVVLSSGLVDGHVHFEASDPMPLLWLRLASGQVRAGELQFYSDAALARMDRDEPGHARRIWERDLLAGTRDARADLMASVPGRPARDAAALTLAAEREDLVAVWQAALASPASPAFLELVDGYLFRKDLFLRRHQQAANRGPGLDRFRDFLDRGETLGEKRAKGLRVAVKRQRFERMLSLATEPRHLRAIELRVAPQKDVKGWWRLFTLWEAIAAVHPRVADGLVVRFIVHFIRRSDPSPSPTCGMRFGALRQTIDRQTAALQAFRARHPGLARWITGIDVANLERGCPPELFAAHLNLMRGDRRLIRSPDHPAIDAWRRLGVVGLDRPPPRLPTLGVTYHAGEDHHHPVDGMRAIDGLMREVMRPGDRIGHGLAAGLDVERHQSSRGVVPMPTGVLLDDLVWLRLMSAPYGEWSGRLQVDGDRVIGDLCRAVHGVDVPGPVLERLISTRYALLGEPGHDASPEHVLHHRECWDRGAWAAGEAPAPMDAVRLLHSALPAVASVQRRLVAGLREGGLVVEANPSSNVVTGAVDRLSEHPFARMLEVLDGQVVSSVNTDDPGVFGTSLDVEFGLMFEALLERGVDRVASLAALDAARRLGFTHFFGDGLASGGIART